MECRQSGNYLNRLLFVTPVLPCHMQYILFSALLQPSGVSFASPGAPWEMRFVGHPRNQDAHFMEGTGWEICVVNIPFSLFVVVSLVHVVKAIIHPLFYTSRATETHWIILEPLPEATPVTHPDGCKTTKCETVPSGGGSANREKKCRFSQSW